MPLTVRAVPVVKTKVLFRCFPLEQGDGIFSRPRSIPGIVKANFSGFRLVHDRKHLIDLRPETGWPSLLGKDLAKLDERRLVPSEILPLPIAFEAIYLGPVSAKESIDKVGCISIDTGAEKKSDGCHARQERGSTTYAFILKRRTY